MKVKGAESFGLEGVISVPSAYDCTIGAENATKKPHKIEKTADFSAVFNLKEG